MINHSVINKRIRKAELWAEIRVYEEEYKLLNNLITEIKKARQEVVVNIEQKLKEFQELAEFLDSHEYETEKL